MERFIKLCKICEIILDDNRICRRCGKRHGVAAPGGLTCRDCWAKYHKTSLYREMKEGVKEERINRAFEELRKMVGKPEIDLAVLNAQEKKILQIRFGLADGTCRTQETAAKIFKISQQRISKIEAKIFEKLRRGL